MNIIFLLAPFSVLLGLVAVGAFVWTLRAGQYDDIAGSAARILTSRIVSTQPPMVRGILRLTGRLRFLRM